MGGYPLPVPQGDQIDPYGIYGYNGFSGFSPYSGGLQNSSENFGTALGQAGPDVDPNAPMEDTFSTIRNEINTQGNLIGQEAGNQLNYYGPEQQQFQGAQNNALNQLAAQPGYS